MGLGFGEYNPILKWLMDKLGVIPAMFLMKSVFIYILFEACCLYVKKENKSKRETLAVPFAFVILISAYSYFMYTQNLQFLLEVL